MPESRCTKSVSKASSRCRDVGQKNPKPDHTPSRDRHTGYEQNHNDDFGAQPPIIFSHGWGLPRVRHRETTPLCQRPVKCVGPFYAARKEEERRTTAERRGPSRCVACFLLVCKDAASRRRTSRNR